MNSQRERMEREAQAATCKEQSDTLALLLAGGLCRLVPFAPFTAWPEGRSLRGSRQLCDMLSVHWPGL